ncbi:MAG TPA: pyocin activator PrtN family protein [Burkholderiales bacterium]|nr:pyocin activator PrtN family protein [Burkholderiales bacterium]
MKVDVDVAAIRRATRALHSNPFFNSLVVAAEFARQDSTTLQALIKRFNGPTAPLEAVALEYFGLSREKAYADAGLNRLPVPTFRCRDSQKAPLLVHVEDLAALIDARRTEQRDEWTRSQV